MKSKTAPSRQPIFSLDKKYHRKTFVINEMMTRSEKAFTLTLKGRARSVTPKMHVMLMKQLPTMLPSAKSKCPFRTALMLVASSGTLVPKAMTVTPITTFGMPTLTAMKDAVSTMKQAQMTTPTEPNTAKEANLRSFVLSVPREPSSLSFPSTRWGLLVERFLKQIKTES